MEGGGGLYVGGKLNQEPGWCKFWVERGANCSTAAYRKKPSSEDLAKWPQSRHVVSMEGFQCGKIPVGG